MDLPSAPAITPSAQPPQAAQPAYAPPPQPTAPPPPAYAQQPAAPPAYAPLPVPAAAPVAAPANSPPPAPPTPVAAAPAASPTGASDAQKDAARKHAKQAISAMNFDDIHSAVHSLRAALAALGAPFSRYATYNLPAFLVCAVRNASLDDSPE